MVVLASYQKAELLSNLLFICNLIETSWERVQWFRRKAYRRDMFGVYLEEGPVYFVNASGHRLLWEMNIIFS